MLPTKQDNAATPVDHAFNMFGVLLNFLVTPDKTGHEISLFKGTLPPGVVIPVHSHDEAEVFYVLEGSLEVYGIDNLRIADASIMPRVTTGNTMAPCVVIGERAGEILKGTHGMN